MFLSVAVSRAEVASSRSNNFGDLLGDIIRANVYGRIDNGSFLSKSMFRNLQAMWADRPEESSDDTKIFTQDLISGRRYCSCTEKMPY